MRSSDDFEEQWQIKKIYKEHAFLKNLNEIIGEYEFQIKAGNVVALTHVNTVEELRKLFNEFMQIMAKPWLLENTTTYKDFVKWKIISDAFEPLADFINAMKLKDTLKISSGKFSNMIRKELINAATSYILQVESQDITRQELKEKYEEIASFRRELSRLKDALSEYRSTNQSRQIERLEFEIIRMTKNEKNLDAVYLSQQLEAAVQQAKEQAAAKDEEIASLREQLQAANKQLTEKEALHNATLKELQSERQKVKEKQLREEKLEQQLVKVLGATASELSSLHDDNLAAKTVIEELRLEIESQKKQNEELKLRLEEGMNGFFQVQLGQAKSDFSALQASFDLMANAVDVLLAKTHHPILPRLAESATADKPGISGVNSRLEQAEKANELAEAFAPRRRKKPVIRNIFDEMNEAAAVASPPIEAISVDMPLFQSNEFTAKAPQ